MHWSCVKSEFERQYIQFRNRKKNHSHFHSVTLCSHTRQAHCTRKSFHGNVDVKRVNYCNIAKWIEIRRKNTVIIMCWVDEFMSQLKMCGFDIFLWFAPRKHEDDWVLRALCTLHWSHSNLCVLRSHFFCFILLGRRFHETLKSLLRFIVIPTLPDNIKSQILNSAHFFFVDELQKNKFKNPTTTTIKKATWKMCNGLRTL